MVDNLVSHLHNYIGVIFNKGEFPSKSGVKKILHTTLLMWMSPEITRKNIHGIRDSLPNDGNIRNYSFFSCFVIFFES